MDLHAAARDGNLEFIQSVVTKENVDKKMDALSHSLIHTACVRGHVHVMMWLIKFGANVNCIGIDGWTPLHYAAHYLNPHGVRLLLAAGADPSIACNKGTIPLHHAKNSDGSTELLIAAYPAGVSVTDKMGCTPLHHSAEYGTSAACSALLNAGGDVNAMDKRGRTPLYLALYWNKPSVIERLLEKNPCLNLVVGPRELVYLPKWVRSFMECRKACRSSCYAILELARRKSKVIGGNRRDVLGLISRIIWNTRKNEEWEK
jgi:ankyrin repeat protein